MTDTKEKDENTYIVKAPGKLSLLGEYAVLEEGSPAIVVALDKSIYCYIRENDKIVFTSRRINMSKIEFAYENKKVSLVSEVDEIDVLSFSKNAIEITLRFLEERKIELKNFEINILSDLSNKYNVKYGFGSSAAVTVSIVGAILFLHGIQINKSQNRDVIFKLSAIAHFISQGSGSGVDIAASTYGGMFAYYSYTSDWLRRELENLDLVNVLLEKDWKFFKHQEIVVLIDFFISVGWTGKAASTKHFLEHVKKVKFADNEEDLKFYTDFIANSKKIVEMFIYGIKNGKKDLINKSVIANRNLLKELAKRSNVEMETDKLKYLVTVAKKLGLDAKFSGAGGGDCGYAVMFDHNKEQELKSEWKKYGIDPVDVKIEDNGVCEVSFITNENS